MLKRLNMALLLMCTSWIASAQSIELAINSDAARLAVKAPFGYGQQSGEIGGNWLHKDEGGELLDFNLHITGDAGIRNFPLMVGIGGRIFWMDIDNANLDVSALAVGGWLRAEMPGYNRLAGSVSVHYAPSVLAFQDADSMLESSLQVEYQLLKNAWAFVGYRKNRVGFEAGGSADFEDDGFVGMRLEF